MPPRMRESKARRVLLAMPQDLELRDGPRYLTRTDGSGHVPQPRTASFGDLLKGTIRNDRDEETDERSERRRLGPPIGASQFVQ
jgi:hypothetical protein